MLRGRVSSDAFGPPFLDTRVVNGLSELQRNVIYLPLSHLSATQEQAHSKSELPNKPQALL